MKNITVGKYIPGNSFVHKLDPRIKLSINIILIVLVFITRSFVMEGIMITPILIAFLLSKQRVRQLFSMLKPVIFIGIFLFAINMFIIDPYPPKNTDWQVTWKSITINYLVIRQTTMIMSRIYIMIVSTSLLMSTTKPMALTKAIEDLMLPLKLIKVPVHIIAMIISIALRFIPTFLEEAQRIMKAQASRGVDFKNGGLKSKAKSMITLIIPLFISSFDKADDLADAMETRGYDPYAKRTRYRAYPIKFWDVIVALIVISLIVATALIRNDVIIVPYWWSY